MEYNFLFILLNELKNYIMKKIFFTVLTLLMIYALKNAYEVADEWAKQKDPAEYKDDYKAVGYPR